MDSKLSGHTSSMACCSNTQLPCKTCCGAEMTGLTCDAVNSPTFRTCDVSSYSLAQGLTLTDSKICPQPCSASRNRWVTCRWQEREAQRRVCAPRNGQHPTNLHSALLPAKHQSDVYNHPKKRADTFPTYRSPCQTVTLLSR